MSRTELSALSDGDLDYIIRRNQHRGVHTYGACPTEGCTGWGRGGDYCLQCAVAELARREPK